MTERTARRRVGRGSGRGAARGGRPTAAAITQQPWSQLRLSHGPIEILEAEDILAIHKTALTALEEIGMRVLEPRARALYKSAGAEVDEGEQQVRFDRAMIEELVAKVPSDFTLVARNPERTVKLGGRNAIFSSVGGPAYVSDLDKGRRAGTYEEMCDYLKVVQSLNVIHQEGGCPFAPLDLPAETRHLDMYYAEITLLDKNWHPDGLGQVRATDALEMVALSHGMTRERLIDQVVFTCVINTNSPLQLDIPMAEGLMVMAEHGQCAIITPFTLAGAMSPITLPGALAQQHAEALAGIALTQVVRPGVPAMYGGFTSNVDMKTGSPAFGTPEYTQAAQVSGQLARHIGVPFRSSNVTAANAVDAQATYESEMALWGCLLGGAHMVNHAAGWLGGGLTASFEKLIVDAEMLQMMAAYFQPMEVNKETLALAAMKDVGPAGHFFGTEHTLERYEKAFYAPLLSNWDNHDTWVERGSITAEQRANTIWKQLLADYQQPPIDPAIDEALKAYVEKRKRDPKISLD